MFSFKSKKKIKQEPFDRITELKIANNNKVKIIMTLSIILVIFAISMASISLSNNTQTLIFEKNGNSYNEVGYANQVSKANYIPNDESIIYFVNNFILKSRNLPLDLVVYNDNYKDLQFFITKRLNDLIVKDFKENKIGEKIEEKVTIDIDIISTLRITDNSFQIRWIENEYGKAGERISKNLYVGLLTYTISPHTRRESIIKNPLGIIFTEFVKNIEKE